MLVKATEETVRVESRDKEEEKKERIDKEIAHWFPAAINNAPTSLYFRSMRDLNNESRARSPPMADYRNPLATQYDDNSLKTQHCHIHPMKQCFRGTGCIGILSPSNSDRRQSQSPLGTPNNQRAKPVSAAAPHKFPILLSLPTKLCTKAERMDYWFHTMDQNLHDKDNTEIEPWDCLDAAHWDITPVIPPLAKNSLPLCTFSTASLASNDNYAKCVSGQDLWCRYCRLSRYRAQMHAQWHSNPLLEPRLSQPQR